MMTKNNRYCEDRKIMEDDRYFGLEYCDDRKIVEDREYRE